MSFHPSTPPPFRRKGQGLLGLTRGAWSQRSRWRLEPPFSTTNVAGPILVTVLGWSPNSNFMRERQKSCIERAKAKGARDSSYSSRRCLSSRFERCTRMVSGRGEGEDHKGLTLRCHTRLL